MTDQQIFDVARLRRVVKLLDLTEAVPEGDAELLRNLGHVLGMVAHQIEKQQEIIRRQALANLTLVAESAGIQPHAARPPLVPCPICGGEAKDHVDALRRVQFVPESLVKPEWSENNDAAVDAISNHAEKE